MKTLEQVIVDCKEEIKDCQIDLDGITELLEKHPERKEAFAYNIDDYKKRMNYNYQLAAWLRELQEIRKDRDYWEEKAHSYEQTIHKLTDAISKQPEIIRCKDCQYFGIDGQKLYCRMWQSYTAENGYCHLAEKAERRTDK